MNQPIPSSHVAAFGDAATSPVKIKAAIIPVGGLGTRMLPLTNAMPKNMLAVGAKPLIEYAVDEALLAGCEEIHIICGPADVETYRRHFILREDIAAKISTPDKADIRAKVEAVTQHAPRLNFIIQENPKGLGHAVLMAKDHIDGPFAVILPDDLIVDGIDPVALADMVDSYRGGIAIAAMEVPDADTKKYGIFSVAQPAAADQKSMVATGIVEKPKTNAPSNLAAIGRYILPYSVMEDLVTGTPGAGGEIQLTDAIERVRAAGTDLHAVRFRGTRYDCGDLLGFARAQNAVSEILISELDPAYKARRTAESHPAAAMTKG